MLAAISAAVDTGALRGSCGSEGRVELTIGRAEVGRYLGSGAASHNTLLQCWTESWTETRQRHLGHSSFRYLSSHRWPHVGQARRISAIWPLETLVATLVMALEADRAKLVELALRVGVGVRVASSAGSPRLVK